MGGAGDPLPTPSRDDPPTGLPRATQRNSHAHWLELSLVEMEWELRINRAYARFVRSHARVVFSALAEHILVPATIIRHQEISRALFRSCERTFPLPFEREQVEGSP